MLPQEALHYADAVVVGEVEGIWDRVIGDFERNELAPQYLGPRVDLSRFGLRPRRDLLHPDYFWQSVQTSRGCPFNCDFCSVTRYFGKAYRQREAREVLDELQTLQGDYVIFLDDNLIGYSPESRNRAAELFKGMVQKRLRKKWCMQTSINVADEDDLIRLAGQAGCLFAFIGFEAIREGILKGMRKGVNLRTGIGNYRKVVRCFHKHGIAVLGAFIVGNDDETAAYYKELARFLMRSCIDIVQITVLTPLPGTDLMERLTREDRLVYRDFPQDWVRYRFSHVVHRPKGVDPDTIYTGNNYLKKRLYAFPRLQYRLLKSLLALRRVGSFVASYKANKAYKRGWQNSHYYGAYPSDF
jgi:radical SAM superfamily enzyme YgiQ (UPF0313 family)